LQKRKLANQLSPAGSPRKEDLFWSSQAAVPQHGTDTAASKALHLGPLKLEPSSHGSPAGDEFCESPSRTSGPSMEKDHPSECQSSMPEKGSDACLSADNAVMQLEKFLLKVNAA
jgi:hypothetical protein